MSLAIRRAVFLALGLSVPLGACVPEVKGGEEGGDEDDDGGGTGAGSWGGEGSGTGGDPVDADGDGWAEGEDCDDADATVFPGAEEACDGQDNDCDGDVDEITRYADGDGDGFAGTALETECGSEDAGLPERASDCDDADPGVNPDAVERCYDAIDNDCDGLRSCVDVVVVVEATGAASGSGTWQLAERVYGQAPSASGDAELYADFVCTLGEPQTFGCEPGSVSEFHLVWADGVMPWGTDFTVNEQVWEGSLYREDIEGLFEYGDTLFWFQQRTEFDASEVEESGGEEGRPFTVAGRSRLAAARSVAGWCPPVAGAVCSNPMAAAHWLRAARAEHASVASFARFALELMALGAPADLLAATTRAQIDEIAHARDCFAVAAQAGAEETGVGALDVRGALASAGDAAAILVGLIREGCVGETTSAIFAEEALAGATVPAVRAALERIVPDETRHAELAWRSAKWLLRTHPGLLPLAIGTFDACRPAPTPAGDLSGAADPAWGVLSEQARADLRLRAWREVVGPAASALLGQVEEGLQRGALRPAGELVAR